MQSVAKQSVQQLTATPSKRISPRCRRETMHHPPHPDHADHAGGFQAARAANGPHAAARRCQRHRSRGCQSVAVAIAAGARRGPGLRGVVGRTAQAMTYIGEAEPRRPGGADAGRIARRRGRQAPDTLPSSHAARAARPAPRTEAPLYRRPGGARTRAASCTSASSAVAAQGTVASSSQMGAKSAARRVSVPLAEPARAHHGSRFEPARRGRDAAALAQLARARAWRSHAAQLVRRRVGGVAGRHARGGRRHARSLPACSVRADCGGRRPRWRWRVAARYGRTAGVEGGEGRRMPENSSTMAHAVAHAVAHARPRLHSLSILQSNRKPWLS
jgi:hypothetical protein